MVVLPVAVLAAARFLADRFPSTHALVDDWYNHAQYFFLFALGALLAAQAAFWVRRKRCAGPAWVCGSPAGR
jgi:hypothetical protein